VTAGLDALDRAPKVELHLHLEGAIPPPTFWELVADRTGEVRSEQDLAERFTYRDFAHFIDTWWWMTQFLDTEEVFTTVGEAVAASLVAQNIVYAEASFSPTDFERHGLTPPQIATALRRGIDRVPEADVALLVDLVRDNGPGRAERTLDAILEVAAETRVVGITIGGSEQRYPPEPFAGVYRRAAGSGLHLTAHAGEAAGPASVWGALRSLGVARIGHGVRSVEDPELLAYLVDAAVPLEVCPTSNLRTGVAASWEDHPVAHLLAAGAAVTINSDDPTLFGSSLASDLAEVVSRFGASAQDLTLTAARSAFLEMPERAALEARVRAWWDLTG
jgi:adenosine deaminase